MSRRPAPISLTASSLWAQPIAALDQPCVSKALSVISGAIVVVRSRRVKNGSTAPFDAVILQHPVEQFSRSE
jgi:hypothetical protein